MRLIYPIMLTLLLASSGIAQSKVDTNEKSDIYSLQTVKRLLWEQENRFSSGIADKFKPRLGDRISIALIKIFDLKELENPQKIKIYLPLIRAAFADPNLIEHPEDKEPKVTLYLLEHLKNRMTDERLREEITEVIKVVKQQTRPPSNNSFNPTPR